MNTITGLNRLAIAACASAITAASTWAFVDATASTDRDPFHFASTMAANSNVRVAQAGSHLAPACRRNSEIPTRLQTPVCLRG